MVNYLFGQAYLRNEDPRHALEPFRRALELNPQNYETCIQIGLTYQATKDYPKAREFFNKAIEVDAMRTEAVDALNKLNELEHPRR